MKGFKAFDKDLKCRDFQYEIGKTYRMDGEIEICERGFHFCKDLGDCYLYYPMNEETRICRIKAVGDIKTDNDIKYCTNEIIILSEVKNPRKNTNINNNNSGYFNSGYFNSGIRNSGLNNSGDRNTGNENSGCFNSGYRNSGSSNTRYENSGNYNSGNFNIGNYNTGNENSGSCNSGNCNRGRSNTGDCNIGESNSGYWNSGNWNSGVFNTNKTPKIKMFDKQSKWTIEDWYNSEAFLVMLRCPCSRTKFIIKDMMSRKEKHDHPEYKTIDGYLKEIIVTSEDKQKWWDELSEKDKDAVRSLPNFNAKKFKECTEIEPR